MRSRFSAILVSALAAGGSANAASLTGSSPGFHYFYKQGATMEAHDAALVDCAVRLRAMVNGSDAMGAVTAATGGGLMGALIGGIIDNNENRQGDAANTEGCMAIKGWSVVALSDEEGRATEQPDDPATIREKLRPYVEAPTPRGEILRAPFANELALGPFEVGKALDLEEVSMSVRATKDQSDAAVDAAGTLKASRPDLPKDVKAPKTIKGMKTAALASADPLKSFVVFRQIGQGLTVNGTNIALSRLASDGSEVVYDGEAVDASLGGLNNPKIAKTKIGDDKIYDFVVEVPPGLWKLSSIVNAQYVADLCFGAPAFNVGEGDVIFVGALSVRNEGGYPVAADLDVAKEMLAANPALADKVKPAQWTNGFTADCFGSYAYAYEMPGAPFIDMPSLARAAAPVENAESPSDTNPSEAEPQQ